MNEGKPTNLILVEWIGLGHRDAGKVMLDVSDSRVGSCFSTITPMVSPLETDSQR